MEAQSLATQRPRLVAVTEFLVVGICTCMFALTAVGICGSLLAKNAAGTRDFVEYWAAGTQLVRHANPYDVGEITLLERSAGFPPEIAARIMPNPPSALLLVYPLGFLSARAAEFLWLLLLIICLVVSVRMIWIMHGRPKNQLQVLGYSFAPALSCLLSGQVTIFILLGLVLFLRFHRSRPFLAGVSLWLCMLKPHLFVPFGLVLILWAMLNRNYKILAGTVAALGATSLIPLILDPQVWVQYFHMMKTARVDRVTIPCLSVILRQSVWPHTFWIQCLPVAVGSAWAISYFFKRRNRWNWVEHG